MESFRLRPFLGKYLKSRNLSCRRRVLESLPLRQQQQNSNKINRSLIVIGFCRPDWYTRVAHVTLSMTCPWKHPDRGYYWFRKRVPDNLRSLLGKREERFSLGTRDPSEAKRLHVLKLAEVEERWSTRIVSMRKRGWTSC
jgi:hypothetical protein